MNKELKVPLLIWIALFAITVVSCGQGTPAKNISVSTPVPSPSPAEPSASQVTGELGAELDEFIQSNYPLFSGAVLVARQGEVLLSKGYKYANWELEVDNTPDTKFRIASITKSFTAAAVLMLEERDSLDVQDRLCEHISDCPVDWEDITIHQLLTHTAGIPEYTTLPGAFDQKGTSHSVAELIDIFKAEPLNFEPGEAFEYSNSGYVLLGALIEEVSGEDFGEFVTENILLPFALNDTGYDRQGVVLKGRAAGYDILGDSFVNAPFVDMSNTYAAGGLYSTVGDLYHWEQALIAGKVISKDSFEMMIAPQVHADPLGADYGYGWVIADSNGHSRVGHEGGLPGFHSFLAYYPDDQASVIVLSNIAASDVLGIVEGIEPIILTER
jgi:CubicO group peptidase (beta-lactamase class C family)